jgi:hypothetical protein
MAQSVPTTRWMQELPAIGRRRALMRSKVMGSERETTEAYAALTIPAVERYGVSLPILWSADSVAIAEPYAPWSSK